MSVEIFENAISLDDREEFLRAQKSGIARTYLRANRKIFEPILRRILTPLGIELNDYYGAILHYVNPAGVHADGMYSTDGTKPSTHTILIPLAVMPIGSETHTVYFEQIDETEEGLNWHGYRRYRAAHASSDTGKIVTDYSELTNLSSEPFDMEIYKKYLSFMDYGHLEGLSIHKIAKWNFGDVVKFESNRLHCSSDYNKFGVQYKNHLLFKALM